MVKLLGDIDFTADCGEVVTGTVTAMPGMKLLVVSTDPDVGKVICKTEDQDLQAAVKTRIPAQIREKSVVAVSFAIPLEDFRLGYANVLEG